MKGHTIITIGRQFGSGGHEVGLKLSERLGIPVYDRNLIKMAAEHIGVGSEEVEAADEGLLGQFLSDHEVAELTFTNLTAEMLAGVPMSDQVFLAQSEIIRRLARREPCIIIGRCADYILENDFSCINAFIYAEITDRIERIKKLYNLNDEEAWAKIKDVDRARKDYYEMHTGNAWGGIESHQMLFNVSLMEIQDVVDILAAMFRSRR